jgi:hypothetical protein
MNLLCFALPWTTEPVFCAALLPYAWYCSASCCKISTYVWNLALDFNSVLHCYLCLRLLSVELNAMQFSIYSTKNTVMASVDTSPLGHHFTCVFMHITSNNSSIFLFSLVGQLLWTYLMLQQSFRIWCQAQQKLHRMQKLSFRCMFLLESS